MRTIGHDILLGLPIELTCRVLGVWLCVKDVVNTDSAYCQSLKRRTLLSALALPYFSIAETFQGDLSLWSVEWALLRNVRMKSLAVSKENSMYSDYTEKFGSQVENLTIQEIYFPSDDSDGLYSMIQHCTNLVVLEVKEFSMSADSAQLLLLALDRCTKTLRQLIVHDEFDSGEEKEICSAIPNKLQLSTLMLYCSTSVLAVPLLQSVAPEALKTLDLYATDTSICAQLLLILPKCVNLVTVALSGYLQDEELISVLEMCPQIEHLDISGAWRITDACAATIARAPTGLQSLNVSRLSFTDILLDELAEHCTGTLQSLNVELCYDMTDAGINNLLQRCSKLQTLHFSFASGLGNHLSFELMQNLTTLVMHCGLHPFPALESMSLHCRQLMHVEISLHEITPEMLALFTEATFSQLHTFNVHNTRTRLSLAEKSSIVHVLQRQLPKVSVMVKSPSDSIRYF